MGARLESGDLILAATDVDDRQIDLRRLHGPGRLLHLDPEFKLKQTLWTGQEGLVVGIGLHPQTGLLYTADPHNQNIVAFDAEGQCLGPLPKAPRRPFGAVAFDKEGRLVLGVHSARRPPPEDRFGDAKLFVADAQTGEPEVALCPAIDGGRTGWHCITSMALDRPTDILEYASEGGRTLARFDIRAGRQLSNYLLLPNDDPRKAYGLAKLPGGRRILATGGGASLLSEDGATLAAYQVALASGWTRISLPPIPGDYFYLNNFLEGLVQKRLIETGAVLAEHDIRRKCSLCGLAEVP